MSMAEILFSKYPMLLDKRGRINSNIIRKHSEEIMDLLGQTNSHLHNYKLSEQIFVIIHGIDPHSNECEVCGGPCSLDTVAKKFRSVCSPQCVYKSPTAKEKRKVTCLEKYGATTNLITAETREHTKRKLGGLGLASPKIKEKVRETTQKRYGVDNVFQHPSVIEKIKRKHQNKYSGKHYSQQHISDDTLKKLQSYDFCKQVCDDKNKTFSAYAEENQITTTTLLKYIRMHELKINRKPTSSLERLICEFLDSIKISYITNTRDIINREIDIFIPEFNIAIEINGLYWHSEKVNSNRQANFQKYKQCREKNIQLLTFYEHQFHENVDVIKSIIRHKCKQSNRIYARNCQIITLSSKEKRNFFDDNHIDGDAVSSINIGLECDGILYAAISIGKSRFDKSCTHELIRFATLTDHAVIGGFSKLFNHAINNNPDITAMISYANLSISNNGDVYNQNKFQYLDTTSISYFYWRYEDKKFNIKSRYSAQKSKLQRILPQYNSANTEYQNMLDAGWNRVWTMPSVKYKWTKGE